MLDNARYVDHKRERGRAVAFDGRYHFGIIAGMAMTLRLTDGEAEALRRQAEREDRSMQDVARQAVRDYIERAGRRELLERVLDEDLPRYAEALRRLGE